MRGSIHGAFSLNCSGGPVFALGNGAFCWGGGDGDSAIFIGHCPLDATLGGFICSGGGNVLVSDITELSLGGGGGFPFGITGGGGGIIVGDWTAVNVIKFDDDRSPPKSYGAYCSGRRASSDSSRCRRVAIWDMDCRISSQGS